MLLDTRGRLLLTGAGVAAALLLFPLLLWRWSRQDNVRAGVEAGWALLGTTLLAILFRTAGSGVNLLAHGPAQALAWLLAVVALGVFWRQDATATATAPPSSAGRGLLPAAIGLTSAFALLYFAFASPNVLAAWTGAGLGSVLGVLLLAAAIWAAFAIRRPRLPGRSLLWLWNGLFVAALTAAILPQQIRFPAGAGGYPLFVGEPGALQLLPLYLAPAALSGPLPGQRALRGCHPPGPPVAARHRRRLCPGWLFPAVAHLQPGFHDRL